MAHKGQVAVIGAGFYGSTTALRLAEYDIFDEVVLTDIRDGWAEGLALDLNEARPIEGFETTVTGRTTGPNGEGYGVLAGAGAVVITAGLPRKPGVSRMDLIEVNAKIVRQVVENVAKHAPEAVLIIVSNPLDEMTALAAKVGVEAEIGAGGVKSVVERDLTPSELAGLREAAGAVRAKQADVASL
jgi:malate dehydrogenase